jgi:multiple sugar transport system ATP-binding protein
MVYVTHDQSEALTLGDRIVVLKEGIVQQAAPPMELYSRPANRFVAGFIGSPAMNLFDGTLSRNGEVCTFTGKDIAIEIPCTQDLASGRVTLGVRPQHLSVGSDADGSVRGEAVVVEPMGNEQIVYVMLPNGTRVVAVTPAEQMVKAGEMIAVSVRGDAAHVFDGETGARVN